MHSSTYSVTFALLDFDLELHLKVAHFTKKDTTVDEVLNSTELLTQLEAWVKEKLKWDEVSMREIMGSDFQEPDVSSLQDIPKTYMTPEMALKVHVMRFDSSQEAEWEPSCE